MMMMYRREIDGLRAVAVLPVMAFHAGLSFFPGGFIGVDIFFVISGFLITSILIQQVPSKGFLLVDFYERRARRILPALFFVMLVTIPFAWILFAPADYKAFARSIVAVVLFVSNILFWRESGYFDLSSEFKPLLHTWSLAVEEQFYLFFPLILCGIWRFGRVWVMVILGILSIASLIISESGALTGSAGSFYLLPSRFWELAAGALLAIYMTSRWRKDFSQTMGEALSLIGMGLIFASLMFYRGSMSFPGLSAVAPVLGAVLVILASSQQNIVGRVLASPPLVGVGLISYSLYLWHQPVLAIARNWSMGQLDGWFLGILFALLFVLAYVSWRFVELPFRVRGGVGIFSRKVVFGTAVLAGFLLLIFGLFLDNKKSFESNLTPRQIELLQFSNYRDSVGFVSGYRLGSCYYGMEDAFASFDSAKCLMLESDKKNYLLLGDSHAAHLWRALSDEFPGINIMQANASNCRPVIDASATARCRDLLRFILDDYLTRARLDGVILSARWSDSDFPKLLELVDQLRPKVGRVIIIGPTIEYIRPLPLLLLRRGDLISSHRLDVSGVVDDSVFHRSDEMSRLFAGKGVSYVDIASSLCVGRQCVVTTPENVPLVWDYGHFTIPGAKYIVSFLHRGGLLGLL